MNEPNQSQEPGAKSQERYRYLDAVLIALAGLVLLNGAWSGGFTSFDDIQHVKLANDAVNGGAFGFLKPQWTWSYMPVTILSYQFDRALFSQTLHLSNWAPGVRLMTYVYHVGAALAVWRIVLLLGFRRLEALFIAMLFAAHPLACETVAWVSERKNALAALFGFAALWVFLGWGVDIGARRRAVWRIPLATVLYVLALVSKPSALGLLPVFGLLEIVPFGLRYDTAPLRTRFLRGALRCLPLAAAAAGITVLNIHTHGPELCTPPGGTVFTAMLTDLEILSRYLFNLVAPGRLSAFYFVDPIVSLNDPRAIGYFALLVALFAVTMLLSQQRWRTAFAWGWLVGALGPNLNLIAIPLFMQDRYMYLSTPAFAMILADVFGGGAARAKLGPSMPRIAGAAYLLALASLAAVRAPIWGNAVTIFSDAVEKQPLSANARYDLGMSFLQASEKIGAANPEASNAFMRKCIEQWKLALDTCPDVTRFAFYSEMALRVGEDFMAAGDSVQAEKYWIRSANPPPGVPPFRPMQSAAIKALITLENSRGRFQEGLAMASDLIRLEDTDESVLLHARTAYLLAQKLRNSGDRDNAGKLIALARFEMNLIAPASKVYAAAREFLKLLDQF